MKIKLTNEYAERKIIDKTFEFEIEKDGQIHELAVRKNWYIDDYTNEYDNNWEWSDKDRADKFLASLSENEQEEIEEFISNLE